MRVINPGEEGSRDGSHDHCHRFASSDWVIGQPGLCHVCDLGGFAVNRAPRLSSLEESRTFEVKYCCNFKSYNQVSHMYGKCLSVKISRLSPKGMQRP